MMVLGLCNGQRRALCRHLLWHSGEMSTFGVVCLAGVVVWVGEFTDSRENALPILRLIQKKKVFEGHSEKIN